MYLKRIELTHIRGLDDINVDLTSADGSLRLHTVLIGKNGTCKTTFLRSIAIGLADSKDASGLLAEDIGTVLAEDADQATIKLTIGDGLVLTTKVGRDDGQDVLVEKSKANEQLDQLMVVGYGINRLLGGNGDFRSYRLIDSVYNLFVYDSPLIGTELALRRLRDFVETRSYQAILGQIKDALGLDRAVTIHLNKGGGVTFSGPAIGKSIPLAGLSDGYKETLGWILDLYSWAMRATSIDENGVVSGILLLDEIEQHLYPGLQTDLLGKLRQLFPKLQIVTSTHSPMIALGVNSPAELIVFRRTDNGKISARPTAKPLSGYSVEDMVVDPEIFESQAYGPETSAKLSAYQQLVKKKVEDRDEQESEELRTLSAELIKQQLPIANQSDEMRMLKDLLKKHELDK